jgi:hypothetical protein
MADAYGIGFSITTAGYTGMVSGFISNATQTVNIVPIKGTNGSTIGLTANAGILYPLKCKHVKPASSPIIGLNP